MYRVLTKDQIKEAKKLKMLGYSKRELADMFEVGETTIWDNVFRRGKIIKKRKEKQVVYSYKKLQSVIMVVKNMRDIEELTSLQIAKSLSIPLEEVNFILSHNPPPR